MHTTAGQRARVGAAAAIIALAITLGACGDDADTDATAPAPAAAPITQAGDARDPSGRDEAPTDAASSGAGERSKAKIGAASGGTGAEVVERVLVDHYAHPSCEELTPNAERQFGYGPGPDCDTVIAERNPPKKVTVSDVTVNGAMATAVASGFTFKFVRRDGVWLIDGTR